MLLIKYFTVSTYELFARKTLKLVAKLAVFGINKTFYRTHRFAISNSGHQNDKMCVYLKKTITKNRSIMKMLQDYWSMCNNFKLTTISSQSNERTHCANVN